MSSLTPSDAARDPNKVIPDSFYDKPPPHRAKIAATHRRNHSAFGSKRERQVAELLRAEGWVVFHNKASRGVCDLVALAEVALVPGTVTERRSALLVEVKGTTRSPWVAWGPKERAALVAAAQQAGAEPMLAWWPPHGELQWIGAAEWPT